MAKNSWVPAEQHFPELLNDLMHMGVVEYDGRVIQQYKHRVTRRYINVDSSGHTWQIAVDPDTGEIGAQRISLTQAKHHVLAGIRATH